MAKCPKRKLKKLTVEVCILWVRHSLMDGWRSCRQLSFIWPFGWHGLFWLCCEVKIIYYIYGPLYLWVLVTTVLLFYSSSFYADQYPGYAEVGLLSLWLSNSLSVSLVEFLLTPACPIEKIILWVTDLLFFMLRSESEEGETEAITLGSLRCYYCL